MARLYLDTNILLHAKPLQDIPWEEHATPPITIFITTTNIRELDRHKDQHPKKHLRERARKALLRIEAALAEPTIRHDVRVHIDHQPPTLIYETYGLDPNHPDDTIIASALQAQHDDPEDSVILYTHDVGPRITAARLGITARELPANDRLPPQQDEIEKENERLKRELHDIKAAAPQLHLQINGQKQHATASTLASTPPTIDEDGITNAARAARDRLPHYETLSTTEVESPYVDARHILNLGDWDISGNNVISQSEYQRYQSESGWYEEQYRTHLRDVHDSMVERARSVALTFTLHNDGGQPGEDIRVTVAAPLNVTIAQYPRIVPREPSLPARPRTNGELHTEFMEKVIARPNFSLPSFIPNINPSHTGPDIEQGEIRWWIRRLRHTYHSDLGTLYMTLTAPLKPFTLSFHLHATNATKPFEGKILITPHVPDIDQSIDPKDE